VLFKQLICDLLRVVQSDDVETRKKIISIVRDIPVPVGFTPSDEFQFTIFADPNVAGVKVLVGSVGFAELVEYLANVVEKHGCL
jgi:hypothetical protein